MTDNVNPNQQPELSERDAELLSAYIDNMLTEVERSALEARLNTDSFLLSELAALRQTVQWINQLPIYKAPRDFTITADDVRDTAAETKLIPLQNRNWWRYVSAAAAVIVIAFGVFTILPQLTQSGGDSEAVNVASAPTSAEIDMADEALGDSSEAEALEQNQTTALSNTEAQEPVDITLQTDTAARSENSTSGDSDGAGASNVAADEAPAAPPNPQTYSTNVTPTDNEAAGSAVLAIATQETTLAESDSVEEEAAAESMDVDVDDSAIGGAADTTDFTDDEDVSDNLQQMSLIDLIRERLALILKALQ